MSDIIHLLPDSIANQIAAGEVIQRPASVVKELVENAVDAGAFDIKVIIKDAGRTLIKVADDGKGMSETDARMAFERHATSKISTANDLFSLHTMGFRGEALASIAAVAHVELRTRPKGSELGTCLSVAGSELQGITPDACAEGSAFSVKNLFFNVPARRKFLKSNETEFRHIITEFERVALVNPQIAFSLYHNDTEILNLPESGLRQRIMNVYGKSVNKNLLSVDAQTSLVSISGFIGTPDSVKKKGYLQYFFVNGRFMRHPYFHKAVMSAYDQLIPTGGMPNYFIYFTIDPSSIDVNIHPTKTEIKFESEQSIWQILSAAVREGLAKSSAIPSIDFNTEGLIDIPVYNFTEQQNRSPQMPSVKIDPSYNPFKESAFTDRRDTFDWTKYYKNFEDEGDFIQQEIESKATKEEDTFFVEDIISNSSCYQYKDKYIITSLKSGLALIDQHRAHTRILFDRYLAQIEMQKGASQQVLFPEIVELTAAETTSLSGILTDLYYVGFDLSNLGNNSYAINGVPAGLENLNPADLVKETVNHAMETGCETRGKTCEAIALSLAKAAAIPYGKTLSKDEMDHLLASLFLSSSPTYGPDGKVIVSMLTDDDLNKRFK